MTNSRLVTMIETKLSSAWRSWTRSVSDLLFVWVLLMLGAALVPRTSYLADPSLLPWLAMTLSICLWLRGRSLLPAAHPALTPRRSAWSGAARRLALTGLPWTVLLWIELVWDAALNGVPDVRLAGGTGTMVITTALLIGWGQRQHRTAWNPRCPGYALLIGGALLLVPAVLWLVEQQGGRAATGAGAALERLWAPPLFVAGTLLLAGLLAAPPRNVRQFLAGQLHLMPRERIRTVGHVMAMPGAGFALSGTGLLIFHAIYLERFASLGFDGAIIHTLFVCLCCSALFPRRTPVAMACVFHELEPTGGRERSASEEARDFTEAPEGALIFNPLNVRTTGRIHPALVPVECARLPLLDARAPHLWSLEGLAPQTQMLGQAAFEPEGQTPQWRVVTIRKATRELVSWRSESRANLQRILIMRPFSRHWFRPQRGAFEHEGERYPGQVQSMADLSDTMTLMDGDIVVLSVGGLIRAYQFEIGGPVHDDDIIARERPPVLEDYVPL